MMHQNRARDIAVRTLFVGMLLSSICFAATVSEWKSGKIWQEPKVIDPGADGNSPSDAIVLFDGREMSAWKNADEWEIKDGAVTVTHSADSKNAETKRAFGDCQLHLEWAEPEEAKGFGQRRGNSGVLLMGRYEVQVLDSYKNKTYFDGQCGAIYKQYPPLVNVCRKPGEWQSYDIIFEAPKFDADGGLLKPAYITVLQNGVLIQNHAEIQGKTGYNQAPLYTAHETAPLQLQDHGDPVKFRNIWIRELTPQTFKMEDQQDSAAKATAKSNE
jgi:hypothetical protein